MVRWLTSHLQQPGFNSWLWPLSPASCQCWEAASDGSRNWDPTTHVRPGLGFWQFAPAPASSNHCGYLESEPADGSPVSQIHFFKMKKKNHIPENQRHPALCFYGCILLISVALDCSTMPNTWKTAGTSSQSSI